MYSTNRPANSSFSQNTNNNTSSSSLPQRLFTRREVIPPRNDVLWRIERGAVRTLTWSEDGAFITLGYWGVREIWLAIHFPALSLTKLNV